MRQALFRNFASAFVLVSFFCTAWISASGFPQATQGSVAIAGIVVDQNDALIPNAEVTVANESSISSRTDADGHFHFDFGHSLPSKTCSASGMKAARRRC